VPVEKEPQQHEFLNRLRKTGVRVSVYLTTGERLDGQIRSFDVYSVSLNCPEPRLIVKTSIASVQPYDKAAKKPRAPLVQTIAATPAKPPVIQRKIRRLPSEKT
jgi:RNA chaperone Hfq